MNDRKPYALLKGSGRHFHVRVGDRLRPMSREEIFPSRHLRTRHDSREQSAAEAELRKERDRHQLEGKGVYWIVVKPLPAATLNIQDHDIRGHLQNAERTGNRVHGWNFMNPYSEPELKQGRLVAGTSAGRIIEVHEDGSLFLTIDLEGLRHFRGEREVHPFALIEYPVALFRLASYLYRDHAAAKPIKVLADAALIGIKEWVLRPYSPGSLHFQRPLEAPSAWTEARDLIWERPLVFSGREVVDEPDWCGFRLVRRIYEAFGYFEDKIPHQFDRNRRRLVIPRLSLKRCREFFTSKALSRKHQFFIRSI